MNVKSWCLGIYAAVAVSAAQAGGISEISADRLNFRLIPVVVDERDIPLKDKAKYRQIEFQADVQTEAAEPVTQTFNVTKEIYLTQNDIQDVRVDFDALGQFAVNIELTRAGRKKWKRLSQAFLHKSVIMMDSKQRIHYSDAFVRYILDSSKIQLSGGMASLTAARKVADGIIKNVEFRGIAEESAPSTEFEPVTLKSMAAEREKSFTVWVNPDKAISVGEMDKLQLVPLGEPSEEGHFYRADLSLKTEGKDKLDRFATVALVDNRNKFLKFVTDSGFAETLTLDTFFDEEHKTWFLQRIMK